MTRVNRLWKLKLLCHGLLTTSDSDTVYTLQCGMYLLRVLICGMTSHNNDCLQKSLHFLLQLFVERFLLRIDHLLQTNQGFLNFFETLVVALLKLALNSFLVRFESTLFLVEAMLKVGSRDCFLFDGFRSMSKAIVNFAFHLTKTCKLAGMFLFNILIHLSRWYKVAHNWNNLSFSKKYSNKIHTHQPLNASALQTFHPKLCEASSVVEKKKKNSFKPQRQRAYLRSNSLMFLLAPFVKGSERRLGFFVLQPSVGLHRHHQLSRVDLGALKANLMVLRHLLETTLNCRHLWMITWKRRIVYIMECLLLSKEYLVRLKENLESPHFKHSPIISSSFFF